MGIFDKAGLSGGSVFFIFGGGVLVILIIILGIFPAKSQKVNLDNEARNLDARIEEQRILYPLYAGLSSKLDHRTELEAILEEMENYTGPVYVDNAAQILASMADQAEMHEAGFTPVPESLTRNSDRLLVEGALKGDYQNFREFLLRLTAWDHFNRLELLEVQSRLKHIEYDIRVWISIS